MKHQMDRREFIAWSGAGLTGLVLAGASNAEVASHPPDSGEPYTFLAVADPHLSENRDGELTGREKFRRTIAAIQSLEPAPDFMLLLGDIHPTVLEELLPEIPVPIRPVAGNHEGKGCRDLLRSLCPETFQDKDFYRFEHKGDLFIGMSNAGAGDHVGHFETEANTPSVGQCEWLAEQLADRDRYNRVILFGHIPPEPEIQPNSMCLGQNDGRWLHEQVRQSRPTALFFGHRHHRVWFDIDGVPVYGMRSCNWNLHNEPVGFGHVHATAEGLDVQFISSAAEA